MKSSQRSVLKNPVLWALIFIVGVCALFLAMPNGYVEKVQFVPPAVVVIGGYFITHYLIQQRELRQKRLEQCLALVKGLRFLVVETRLKEEKGDDEEAKKFKRQEKAKLIDALQDAYYGFSLLAKSKSHKLLEETIEEFIKFLESQDPSAFNEKQKQFINQLRADFFIDEEIDFKTYDIKD